MNKKQKILAILGLGLVLFLIGTPSLAQDSTPPALNPLKEMTEKEKEEYHKSLEALYGAESELLQTSSRVENDPDNVGHLEESKPLMFAQYIAATIGGYLVKMAAYLTNLSLELNFKILDTDYNPYVINGWRISRDLANLGFVLFIIIIAIATILRYQEYAAKSTLAKLIAVALLVNFSLMGAGLFVDFSNMLTNFFIKGAAGGSASDLATTIVSSWNPGGFLETEKIEDEGGGFSITGLITGALKAVVAWIASLFFVIIFTLLMAFVLFALAIMFLIRYVILNILLVLVPLACLFWVIPATKSLWEKWWHHFMRWILFAPVASFFLFLAIKMTEEIKRMGEIGGGASMLEKLNQTATTNGIEIESIANAGLLPQLANGIILIGFVLGGLMVANSLGITGAKTFYGWAQSAGKGVGKFIGRKTLEGTAGRILGSEKVKGWTEKLSASKIPGVSYVGRGINRLGAGVEEVTKKPYEELAKKLSPERLNYEILNSRGTKRATLLSAAAKRKDINMEKLAPVLNNPEEMRKIQGDLKRAGINFKDVEKTIGRSFEMITAETEEKLRAATDEFVRSLTPKDYAKGQWNDVFKETDNKIVKRIQENLAVSFAQYEHGAYAKITPNIKSGNLNNFKKIMDSGIEIAKQHPNMEVAAYAYKASDRLKKTLDRRGMFGEEAWLPPKEETT